MRAVSWRGVWTLTIRSGLTERMQMRESSWSSAPPDPASGERADIARDSSQACQGGTGGVNGEHPFIAGHIAEDMMLEAARWQLAVRSEALRDDFRPWMTRMGHSRAIISEPAYVRSHVRSCSQSARLMPVTATAIRPGCAALVPLHPQPSQGGWQSGTSHTS